MFQRGGPNRYDEQPAPTDVVVVTPAMAPAESTAPTIPTYTTRNHREWEVAVNKFARWCHPDRPDGTGLLGVVLTATQFAAVDGAAAPFERLRPPADVTNAHTTGKQLAYNVERRAMKDLRQAVFGSVPPGILQNVEGYDHEGTMGSDPITLPTLLAYLRTEYGSLSQQSYDAALAALRAPPQGRLFEEILGAHLTAHAIVRPGEVTKISYLADAIAVTHPDTVRRVRRSYLERYPDITEQRLQGNGHFAQLLRAALRAEEALAAPSQAFADHAAPAPIALATPPARAVPPLPANWETVMRNLVRSEIATIRGPEGPSATAIRRPGGPTAECPFHGPCGHDASQCRVLLAARGGRGDRGRGRGRGRF